MINKIGRVTRIVGWSHEFWVELNAAGFEDYVDWCRRQQLSIMSDPMSKTIYFSRDADRSAFLMQFGGS